MTSGACWKIVRNVMNVALANVCTAKTLSVLYSMDYH